MKTITRLEWDISKPYLTGLDRGVFYPPTGPGEAWNGLISVNESTDEANEETRFMDGVRTRLRRRPGEFAGSIEALTYPDSFYDDILVQRRSPPFGVSYRISGPRAYQIHLVYNVAISPGGKSYESREISSFRWDFTTKSVAVPGAMMSAHLVVETDQAYSWTVAALEDVLYGTEAYEPRLPTPAEVFQIFEDNSIVQVIDHGDGTFTVTGPDHAVYMTDATTFEINWPSAVYIDAESYTIHSL